MRPKIVFGLVVLALAFIAAAFLLKPRKENPPLRTAAAPATSEVVNAPPPPMPLPQPTPPPVLTDEERQDAIDAEVSRLQDWSMNHDPASLSNILADLTSPEKDIREAAIEASKQFGSTNAIPALKAAAVNSTNTDEQIEMLQAAEFLTLPSISDLPPLTPDQKEALKEKQAQRRAQTQPNLNQTAPPAASQTGQN